MFKVKDIMSQPVISVEPEMPIYDAIRLLASRNVSGLPVVDSDLRLIGLLSEKDVLSLLYNSQDASGKTVGDFMSKAVVSFDINDNVVALCDCLEHNAFRRVPVTQNGRLTGVVSRSDVIRAILQLKHEGATLEQPALVEEEGLVPYSPAG
jgi:CBS domain-containing protein